MSGPQPPRRVRPPALLLEQLLLGELSDARRAALEEEFGAAHLARLRAELAADSQELLSHVALERLPDAAQTERRVARLRRTAGRQRAGLRGPYLQRLALVGVGLLSVVTAVTLGVPGTTPEGGDAGAKGGDARAAGSGPSSEREGIRIKGLAPRILVFRKRGDVVKPLADGDPAGPGDLLQLGYIAAGRKHGVLLSVDGRGVTTLHFPEQPEQSTALGRGRTLLASAYALDDAPRFERFILVTGKAPIDVAAVRERVEALADEPAGARRTLLSLPEGLEQRSLVLRKVTP